MEDELLEALESVTNEPFNLGHLAAYNIIGLRYRWEIVEKWLQTRGRRSTSNRPQVIRLLGAFQSRPNNLTHI